MNQKTKPTLVGKRLEGRYANYFKVGYNAYEFVLDFGQFYAEGEAAQFHTRIITSPVFARALATTLIDSLALFEQTFGAIPPEEDQNG